MRVVALGGGHGLAVTLTALRLLGVAPTAIVAVADDGGSSGRLRRDLGLLPPGDLRKALLALADPTAEVRQLFGYRFERGDLAGHNLGNLALAALTDLKGGFLEAIEEAAGWLRVHGQVLPGTLVPVRLCGRVDGRQVEGQVAIATASGRVELVWLEPRDPAAVPAAVAAVGEADLVLLGPGSTFTSVVPNLLVPELAAALVGAQGRLVYVCNLEAQPGETSGFAPESHLAAILDHCPGLEVATVLCQRPRDAAAAARELRAFAELGAAVVHAEVAADDHPGRHDAARLATALKELA
ncbi:MAG TPA: uridine diphosphate-N-acetylglucosamine-binding protein YvcK [Actinomycetota bacterium]|nr:uridine diphosphate-N-acetylglucosamine-binding protein YvcK [Actinomycetota bacterium]